MAGDDEDDDMKEPPNTHARSTDPDTSHDAADSVRMNEQRFRVLGSYYLHRHEMIDHEAYIYAGIPQSGWTHQRCSDLRHANWIALTGNKGITPAGKAARKCIITDDGIAAYEAFRIGPCSPPT